MKTTLAPLFDGLSRCQAKYRTRATEHVRAIVAALILIVAMAQRIVAIEQPLAPFWAVGELSGEELGCLRGAPAARVGLFACAGECGAIPWQLDERDVEGRLALTEGPQPNPDESPDLVDDNDEIRWMASDAGRRMRADEAPDAAVCAIEIELRSAGTGWTAWVYAFVFAGSAPRSPLSYVHYDPAADIIAGARVSLGFQGATPQYLGWRDGMANGEVNLLDRLKVRASARFLGLIPMGRDEGDLSTEFVAWRAGPIRVVRRQRQWIRLGFGIRSPTFGSDTYFYRDYAELPVRLRLNFPPTYFFRPITVRAVLDFRDLRGWRLLTPGSAAPAVVGELDEAEIARLNELPAEWFALIGPSLSLVQTLAVSPSLATVKRQVLYEETQDADAPEAVPGEMPGIGYRLTEWNDVGSGMHWFSSTSYALPPDYDPRRLVRELAAGITIESRPFMGAPDKQTADRAD